jgi:prephenate dehydratase
MFFVDLAGRAQDAPVAEAIAQIEAMCEQVLVLGSYPAAIGPTTGAV